MTRMAPLVFFLLGFALLPVAHGAQDAVVTVDQAAIRERPSLDAKIIESRSAGTKIRVSNYNKDGWYKTKTPAGQFGWIWQADLTILAYSDQVRGADLELKDKKHDSRRSYRTPWLFLRGGGLLFGIIPSEINRRLALGVTNVFWGPGAFGEVAVRIEDRLRLALRIGTYSATQSASYLDTAYNITLSGTPILVGLDADITKGTWLDISAGLYGGVSLSNTLTVTATEFQKPNSFTLESSSAAVLINFAARYWFTRAVFGVLDCGLYASQIPQKTVPGPFNGDTPFRDTATQFSTMRLNHIGIMLGGSVGFAL